MSVNIFWMISFSCTHCGLFLLVQTEHHRAGFTHEFVIMKFYIFPSSGVEISPGRETGLRSKRAHSSEGGGGAGGAGAAGAADLFEASDLSFSFTLSLSHSLHTGEFTDMDNFFGRVVNRKFSRCVSLPVNQLALFLCIKLKGSDLGLYRLFTPPPHAAARLQSKDRTTECFHLFSQPCCWLTPSFCPIVFFSLT